MDEGATGAQQPTGVPSESGAQMEGDEPFPTHVSARDRRAFAEEVFDHHAKEIYRYVLAWTGDSDSAVELTAQVLRTAVRRMERLTEPEADVEARLVALARAAVTRRREAEEAASARDAGAFAAAEPVPLLLDAVARLDDARREVLILRQLLGHSTEHAARLLAFDVPVVEELERDACATLWRRLNHAPQTQKVTSWDALTVGAALRQGAQSWLARPDEAVLAGLRQRLLGELDQERKRPAVSVSAGAAGARRSLLATVLAFAMRRRWLLAGCAASATIGTVVALSIGGQVHGSSPCGAPTCLVSTTTTTTAAADDTVAPLPSTPEQSSEQPTSTDRASAGPVFPAVTNRGTQTTGLSTTTTMRGTTTPSSTMPRRSTTTTTLQPTTTSTTPQTTGDLGTTSSTTAEQA
jgi:DNA-directed RNA polymerase specialized sigma24 family protein